MVWLLRCGEVSDSDEESKPKQVLEPDPDETRACEIARLLTQHGAAKLALRVRRSSPNEAPPVMPCGTAPSAILGASRCCAAGLPKER